MKTSFYKIIAFYMFPCIFFCTTSALLKNTRNEKRSCEVTFYVSHYLNISAGAPLYDTISIVGHLLSNSPSTKTFEITNFPLQAPLYDRFWFVEPLLLPIPIPIPNIGHWVFSIVLGRPMSWKLLSGVESASSLSWLRSFYRPPVVPNLPVQALLVVMSKHDGLARVQCFWYKWTFQGYI